METQKELLMSESPFCDAQAFVTRHENAYYFYLLFDPLNREPHLETKRLKTCWVCNRTPAPDNLTAESFGSGEHADAPLMPAEHVAHDSGGMELDAETLNIIWLEDGASAALRSGEDILCVIPPWSGYKDFCGYSKYARGMGRYAWELTGALESMNARVENATHLRNVFMQNQKTAWLWVMQQGAAMERFVGKHENDYNIANRTDRMLDGQPFPPKVVISGTRDGVVYGMTAGVSLPAMPAAEMYTDGDPRDAVRMELGFAAVEAQRDICRRMYAQLSMYASLPWQQITFLAHGHTMPLMELPGFAAVLFVDPRRVPGLEIPPYADFPDGGKINPLWVVPLTRAEYDFLVEHDLNTLLPRAIEISALHIYDGRQKFRL